MSHSENEPTESPSVRVNDRRRFDPDGNVRDGAAEEATEVNGPGETSDPVVPQSELTRVQGELEAARKRVDDLARAFQSLNQDREDFKKRLQREREQMIDVEKGTVALSLVEALDELDLCLSAAATDQTPLAQGVRMIRQNLLNKLTAVGVERLELVGTHYDPNLAEAADMEVTGSEEEDQRILGELRAGYRLKGRVIRPARVKVAKYIAPAQA